MRLLLVSGGTGGHVYPAIALCDAAKKHYRDVEILFVGNAQRMEAQEVPKHGYAFKGLHASGFQGGIINKGRSLMLMAVSYRKSLKILKDFQPDIVIGFGGYVSAPVMLAAHRLKITTMIHEQNSVVGMANKMVAKYMDAIVICYERCKTAFDENRTRLLGNPRASYASNRSFDQAYYDSLQLDAKKPLILVVMGSLGSSSINEIMKSALPLVAKKFQILFVSGKTDYSRIKNAFQQENIKVVDYVDQCAIMKKVDLMICRAGATTAAEITAVGVASIMIPSPYVAHNHQFYNASVLTKYKAAMLIEEIDLNAQVLNDKIMLIMENQSLRKTMEENALKLGKPNASEDILTWCDEMKR